MPIDGIEPPTFALHERRSTTKPMLRNERIYVIISINYRNYYL